MDLYSENFFDHGKFPRNRGRLEHATHIGEEINTSCGDKITVQMKNDQAKIKEIKYEVDGCLVTVASASILSEKLIGKKAEEVLQMTPEDLVKMLGVELTPSRTKCALLPLLAIKKAIKNPR